MTKKHELAKFWCLAVLLISYGLYVFAQSTGTGMGGSAQNVVTSGGGGSVSTNGANIFTGANTFNGAVTNNGDTTTSNLTVRGRLSVHGATTNMGPTTVSNITVVGSINVLGAMTNNNTVVSTASSTNTFYATTFTSNLTVSGRLGINTNVTAGDTLVLRNPPGGSATYVTLQDDGTTPAAGFQFGNIDGNYMLIDADGSNPPNLRIQVAGVSPGNINLRDGSQNMLVLSSGSSLNTYGNGASWAHTFNGGTWTIANTPQINTDVLKIASSGGTLTNGTSFTSLNKIQATNIVSTLPTDLWTRITPETGSTNSLFGNGSGPMQTFMHVSQMTNSPISSSQWVVTGVYTNTDQRASLNVSWSLPAASKAGVYVTYQGKSFMFHASENNSAAVTTNTQHLILGPAAIFSLTNIVGSPVVVKDNTIWQGL